MTIIVESDWWKTLFDEIYLRTDARSVCDAVLTGREVDVIIGLLPIRSDHKVLDLCGGHGRHSMELTARGFTDCTLVDYSKVLTECAKKQAVDQQNPVVIIRSDARCTGLSSESFDHVLILGNSLGYIRLPDADSQILCEAYRLLRFGGWLLVDVTDGDTIKDAFKSHSWHEPDEDMVVCRYRELSEETVYAREMVLSKQSGLIRDATYAVRLYTAESLSSQIRNAGFADPEIHTDFSPHQKDGDYGFMNCRMIAVAHKPDANRQSPRS